MSACFLMINLNARCVDSTFCPAEQQPARAAAHMHYQLGMAAGLSHDASYECCVLVHINGDPQKHHEACKLHMTAVPHTAYLRLLQVFILRCGLALQMNVAKSRLQEARLRADLEFLSQAHASSQAQLHQATALEISKPQHDITKVIQDAIKDATAQPAAILQANIGELASKLQANGKNDSENLHTTKQVYSILQDQTRLLTARMEHCEESIGRGQQQLSERQQHLANIVADNHTSLKVPCCYLPLPSIATSSQSAWLFTSHVACPATWPLCLT